jgi:tetratricopeptide (TPR) repeat protein
MINQLVEARPRQLVAIVSGGDQSLDDIIDLWTDEFSAQLAVIDPTSTQQSRVEQWITQSTAPPAIDYVQIGVVALADSLSAAVSSEMPDDRVVVRVELLNRQSADVDITECDLVEQPVLDRYDIVQSRYLRPLQPDELPEEELIGFFDRSRQSWLPYAAGLPWSRSRSASTKCIKALQTISASGADANRIMVIASETGAGGTTFARQIAFESARAGFLTLVAKPAVFRPNATALASYLYRVQQRISHAIGSHPTADEEGDTAEPAVLIVFDVQHWQGRERELRSFVSELTRSGRSAVVLCVTSARVNDDLLNSGRVEVLDTLFHQISREEAQSLGQHLNAFLAPRKRDRTPDQWLAFWESTRPGPGFSATSFWVALDFWLKRQLDLGESIQTWLFQQFQAANRSDAFRMALLEIASLSIERLGMPEAMLPPTPVGEFPFSVQLDQARDEMPGLALVRAVTASERQWAVAHDLLARYLINATYYDREMLGRLSMADAQDPVHLRLKLLRRIATRTAIAQPTHRHLAMDFAVNVLKLDREGNQEFHRYWKDVIEILEDMPEVVWNTSRTFNHHVAISRRRVATDSAMFQLTATERKEQLNLAIEHIEYGLNKIERTADDESDLNLLNSLARAYQNVADVEEELEAEPSQVAALRAHATDAARKAQQENPNNSHVLETLARDILDNAERTPDSAVRNGCEALSYIFQATMLENSELRQGQLSDLSRRALKVLQTGVVGEDIDSLCRAGNPLGHVAKAWRILGEDIAGLDSLDLSTISPSRIQMALNELDAAGEQNTWLLIRFRYDLLSLSQPTEFNAQLQAIEALEGTGFRMPLQLAVEKAILLHQVGRHHHANSEFKQIRRLLRESDAIVRIPERLRWLYVPDQRKRLVCDAQVVGPAGYRLMAKVRDLQNSLVPLIPQDFGPTEVMTVGYRFKCAISFGQMGPFLKPPPREADS